MSRVDVIVACYNYGRFLEECVESVLRQSHRELRVLIIDDASTDDTPGIAERLTASDPRVELVRHARNLGMVATYNEGIALAKGECMLVMDADDFLLPGAVERALAVFDAHAEIGLAWGPATLLRHGQSLPAVGADEPGFERLEPGPFIRRLAVGNYVPQSAAFVRTSVQKHIGGYVAEVPHGADLDMWVRFGIYSQVARIRAKQCVYRYHGSNMQLRYSEWQDFEERRRVFGLRAPEIREHLAKGRLVEDWIRDYYAVETLKWAGRARAKGALDRMQLLLMDALEQVDESDGRPVPTQ